ncbi:hypothetical protein WIX39_022660 [Variovorax sp. AB1(2024)]|uniref:hypothetical protein n=1 Tax=Variovorax sp. AB1(2024) TaxID=3132214 RepID=UPI0030AFED12
MRKKEKFNPLMLNRPHADLETMKWKEKFGLLVNRLAGDFDDIATYLGHHADLGDFNRQPWTADSSRIAFNWALYIAQALGEVGELDRLDEYKWQFELMGKEMKKLEKAEKKAGAA